MFEHLNRLLEGYGYFAVAGTIALESLGLPLPGEAALIAASIYAATTHRLEIWYVVLACGAGAAVGGIAAYWIGRSAGTWVIVRYGKHVGLTERRMNIAQYVFRRHGALIVFFGRFVAVLRSIAALLAGANRMQWVEFVVFSSAGAVAWAAVYGFTAFYFTNEVKRLSGPVGMGVGILAGLAVVGGLVWAHMHGDELEKKAAKAVKARGG
jgi:membrane protein DedA with SNARE-associated domain